MVEQPDDLKRLVAIAGDLALSAELRIKSIELIGNIGTNEAFLALLGLAANDQLTKREIELALKFAQKIVKSAHY